MSLDLEIYAPINVPINWQSEQIAESEQRYLLLEKYFSKIEGLEIEPNNWPMGYGSLDHDNLSELYQPAAIFKITDLTAESDVSHVSLYVYDSCLAVLNLGLTVDADLSNIDDLAISQRVDELSMEYLAPILKLIYALKTEAPMIQPSAYRFFNSDKEDLTSAKPLWVARMLKKNQNLTPEHYLNWLKNVDAESNILHLGSGNSLLLQEEHYSDVNRIMVMSQFHAALMERIEDLLKDNLKKLNGHYYNKTPVKSLSSNVTIQQYRNDHIEYINIQVSAAEAGVQGKRRELFQQFSKAWGFDEQRERVTKLTGLTQGRLDRLSQEKLRQQNKVIQTLLTFLGTLGLLSLVIDLISMGNTTPHADSTGVLDFIQLLSAEHILNITFMFVILLTLYFYKNHE
ncbi:hypothetical protein ACPUVO_01765 [Pseudocolwellia sp. HL-MZ19]|uniref:hypothetical protein n=1 Tax=Pseudocolwellia sp. HL-MZ19 TaxID=3400846 RepID=UPI003CF34DB1